MNGLHLIADLHDCRCANEFLYDAPQLESFCVAACTGPGLTVVGRLFHAFRDASDKPAGVTGTVVLAESHLAVHTWPEVGGVTLDVYVCNFGADHSARAQQLMDALLALFEPDEALRRAVERGAAPPA